MGTDTRDGSIDEMREDEEEQRRYRIWRMLSGDDALHTLPL